MSEMSTRKFTSNSYISPLHEILNHRSIQFAHIRYQCSLCALPCINFHHNSGVHLLLLTQWKVLTIHKFWTTPTCTKFRQPCTEQELHKHLARSHRYPTTRLEAQFVQCLTGYKYKNVVHIGQHDRVYVATEIVSDTTGWSKKAVPLY